MYEQHLAAPAPAPASGAMALPHAARSTGDLTRRELNALELIARGLSYADIARVTGVSVHTVHTHVKSVYRKLMVHSKTEAVFEAVATGLLRPANWMGRREQEAAAMSEVHQGGHHDWAEVGRRANAPASKGLPGHPFW